MSRDMSTCTCDITYLTPLGASTPKARRKLVDCCTEPDISLIGHTRSPSPNLNTLTYDVNDLPQSNSSSTSDSFPRPFSLAATIRNYSQKQLNKTYNWSTKAQNTRNSCTEPCTCTNLEQDCSERLNKSCESRPMRDSCECANMKRVDFARLPTRCAHEDISHKFCTTCNDILNCAPGPSKGSCEQVEMADKLCPECKELVTPCQPDKPTILGQLYERCRELITSVSSHTNNPCSHAEIENKLCEKCIKIIDSVSDAGIEQCKCYTVYDKLCEQCKFVIKSAPCRFRSCTHAEDKPCELCKDLASDTPSCSKRVCEYVDKTCSAPLIQPMKCDAASYPISSALNALPKLIEVVDGSCEPCNVKCIDAASGSASINTLCNDSSDSFKAKEGKKAKNLKIPTAKKSDKVFSCSKSCDASPFEPIKVIKVQHACKCNSKPKSNVDTGSSSNENIQKPSCQLQDKACDAAPFQSIRSSESCQTEPCAKVDKVCEPKGCISVDTANDPAPFQSVSLVDRASDTCSFTLKPFKQLRLQVSQRKRCRSLDDLMSDEEAAGPVASSSFELRKRSVDRSTSIHNAKDSMCRSSGPESPDSACASARARYYENKLLATLHILQNKEETVRVQAESLAVAESRISSLSARHADLRREIDRKEREIQCLRKSLKEFQHGKVTTFDVSMMAEETGCRENIVTTLQNNLDVIEDLYRESFYETVKQENLIEMLRQSNLDIRFMEKEKSDKITELHNVINTQQWSLDRCQDIAADVENLKMEISNFLNSSNNDSGMWEESVVGGLNEDLQDIATQLMTLRDLLASDCTCGLEEENSRLKRDNEKMGNEMSDLRAKITALEANSRNNSIQGSCMEKQYQDTIAAKETEISCLREKLQEAMQSAEQNTSSYDMLSAQVSHTRANLDEKIAELTCIQKQCRIYEDTIRVLKEELSKSEQIAKESTSLRSEVCSASRRAARMQRRAASLESELARAQQHCHAVHRAYRDKIANALELERELDEAHARGGELCAEAGRVVRAVRCWAHRMRDAHMEQQKQIKEKESRLRSLQKELDKRQSEICPRVWEQREQSVSPPPSTIDRSTSHSKCVRINECHDVRQRHNDPTASSASEMASCSTSPSCKPKRTCLKKKPAAVASSSGIRRGSGWLDTFSARDTTPQHKPQYCVCDSLQHCASNDTHFMKHTEEFCPSVGEVMFSRMERLSEALADGYRRWTRRNHT